MVGTLYWEIKVDHWSANLELFMWNQMAPKKEPKPSLILVKTLAMAEILCRFQQIMSKHKVALEKAKIWDFLLWARDEEKVVHVRKVMQFVDTYQLKMMFASIGIQTMDFSTKTISRVLKIPKEGMEIDTLPLLPKAKA